MQMEHFFAQFQVKTKKKKKKEKKKRSSSKIEHFFFPNSGEDQKKVFLKNRPLFSPNSGEDQKKKIFPQFSLRCTPFQIIEGDTAKLLGEIYPPIPPCFGNLGCGII